MKTTRCYNIQVIDVYAGRDVDVVANCTDWIAINKGAVGVRINGIYLKPYPPGHPELSGESYSPDPKSDSMLFNGRLTAVFDAGAGAWLQLVQMFFTDVPL